MGKAKKFIESITASQLRELIEAVFEYTDIDSLERIFEEVGDDVRKCYETFYGLDDDIDYSEEELEQIKTDSKFSDDFYSLAGDIELKTMELGDEEGEYVSQEHHWECPEFDAYQFSYDLEEIFQQILPMLDKAFELKLEDKDFFLNLMKEIKNGIDSYPEWMGAEYSEFEIEKSGAECFLKWNWLNRESINSFLNETKELFDKEPITSYFIQSFMAKEPVSVLKELYNELIKLRDNPEWENQIDNANSIWHDIFYTAESVVDKKAFLKTSQNMISQKWEYGIPVYEEYLKNKDYEKAEEYCEETAGEFFRQNTFGNFPKNIKTSIYAAHCDKKDSRLDKIFKDWIELCEILNDSMKAGAVEIQYSFYQNPYDWDKLKILFLSNKDLSCYDNYAKEWKLFTTRKTLNQHYSDNDPESWVDYLIDFVLGENKNNFVSKTKKWLEIPLKTSNSYDHGKHFQLLLKLSQDILPKTDILNSSPLFRKYIAGSDYSHYDYNAETNEKGMLKKQRLSYLHKAGEESLKDNIIDTWKKNIRKLIPSPKDNHKSDYSEHAKWLAIAKELNQDTYKKFYNDWKTNHYRRINLWSALSQYGIKK